ncbi:MAG TPA: hypothetical protein VM694_36065, partial [Polyangium sp.]|nr:hypothetical protein [Polyangium sp.]
MSRALALVAVLVTVGCSSNADRSDDPELAVTDEPTKGSAGGFSASLGAELAGSGASRAGSAAETGAAGAPAAGTAAGAGTAGTATGAGTASSGSSL